MDVVSERLQLPKLSELCRKYGVVRLSAYGSVVRDNLGEGSDVDLVVDFEQVRELTASKQYFGYMFELEDLYGRKVDLVERQGVKNPIFKARLEEQEVNVFGTNRTTKTWERNASSYPASRHCYRGALDFPNAVHATG